MPLHRGLENTLGHRFSESRLLTEALTHRSHSTPHNERLEFLGDGVLNCIVAAELYRRFPQLSEGELSRLRAGLVNKNVLYHIAAELDLGAFVLLGDGELKSGGHRRPSILADALEALFGAVFIDAGYDGATTVVNKLFAQHFAQLDPSSIAKDHKTRLQEYLQSRKISVPKYEVLETTGEAHEQTFRVACNIAALKVRAEGAGASRKLAEQEAAAAAYHQISGG
jgi:ribonuclease III